MQSPHQPLNAPGSNATSARTTPSQEFTSRPTLPDRNVTAETIEDAYVRFIFYCNPALPLNSETAALREAFQNPPRSGGKSFSIFTVFELVRKFYDKEIRTWTELTTRLGVEPPDPSKDESAQKIAQYGVRLKKWMNSMHVKAFFEYLMDMENDYWTNIPNDPSPTSQPIRDGVALEDDMALRALLPHIRPKRGRKRPVDEDAINSPAQRTHLTPGSAADAFRQGVSGPWSASPDSHGAWPADPSKMNWPNGEGLQTPLARWPQSAVTPTVRGSFWDDALEPRSAVATSKPKLPGQRRGPKNVSSAWRSGPTDGEGKPRGRPPINRMPSDLSAPAFPHGTPINGPPEVQHSPFSTVSDAASIPPVGAGEIPPYQQTISMSTSGPLPQQPLPDGGRPTRPSISLQVPERPPGSVRLATPPPVVTVNGEVAQNPGNFQAMDPSICSDRTDERTNFKEAIRSNETTKGGPSKNVPPFFFENVDDREHVDEVLGFISRATMAATWLDAQDQPTYPPTIAEVNAIANTTLESMWNTTSSPEAFLINLAAMAGGRIMMSGEARIRRLAPEGGCAKYMCEWEYRLGSIRGLYKMEQTVPFSMFRDQVGEDAKEDGDKEGDEQLQLTNEDWQTKYHNIMVKLQKKDRELIDLRTSLMNTLKGSHKK